MYRIHDTTAAIKEVQRLLDLSPTGAYDTKTKSAVALVQAKYSLEETEVVDYETFTAILNEYHQRNVGIFNSDYLFCPKFPYVYSDMGKNAKLINDAMIPILKDYAYEGIMPEGEFISLNTLRAANFLQAIFRIPISKEIDAELVNRLLIEKRILEIKNKYGL